VDIRVAQERNPQHMQVAWGIRPEVGNPVAEGKLDFQLVGHVRRTVEVKSFLKKEHHY
jgi:hypothetical protein